MKHAAAVALLMGALSLLAVAGTAAAAETIGVIRNVSGDATVTRGEKTFPAIPGLKLRGRRHPWDRSGRVARRHTSRRFLPLGRSGKSSRPPKLPLLALGGKVRPGGPDHPRDDGVPLGPDRQAGPRKSPFRNSYGHDRHPGNALRREGGGTVLPMNAIDPRNRVPA